jgi:phosphoglucosamine mutase
VVDDKGLVVDGYQLISIWSHILSSAGRIKKNGVVVTVMSNMGLDLYLKKSNVHIVRAQVGDRYVMDEMRRGDYNLGGEKSGHLIFRDSSTTGDGILAALYLLQICLESGKSISELRKSIELLPQVLKNVNVSRKVPVSEIPALEKQITLCETELKGRGRVLFRYSGTENLARIMIEGEDLARIDEMAQNMAHIVNKELG